MESMIRDIKLAPSGHDKINWVKNFMPVMAAVDKEFSVSKPFAGKKMVITLHLEAKTAYMAEIFHHAGAEVAITGSNPLSTQDDVAAALVEDGLHVFAWHDCTPEEYDTFINKALDIKPDFVIDDGGEIASPMDKRLRFLLWRDYADAEDGGSSFGVYDSEYRFFLALPESMHGSVLLRTNRDGTGWLICNAEGTTVYCELRIADPAEAVEEQDPALRETDGEEYHRVANIGSQQLQARIVTPYYGLSLDSISQNTVLLGSN